MILTGIEVKNFIKKLYNINQIMKSIYKDEPNFSPFYILTPDAAIYTDVDCIPEIVKYNIKDKLIETNEINFIITIDSGNFFSIFKETEIKNSLTKIEIQENKIKFYIEEKIILELNKNETITNNIINLLNIYNENIRHSENESFLYEIPIPEDIIDRICNQDNKTLNHLILDCTNNTCYFKDEFLKMDNIEDISYLNLFLNKKFANGAYYKIKHLKNKDVVDYTPMSFYLNETSVENNYDVELIVLLKNNDIIEHHFMIIDF